MGRTYRRYQRLSGFVALVLLLLATLIFSLLRPNYNHLQQAFSELGALGAPNFALFNIIVFGFVGLLMVHFQYELDLYFSDFMDPVLRLVQLGAAISWILTGVFPLSHAIHWLYITHLVFAVLSYIFGGLTLILSVKLFGERTDFTLFSIFSIWMLGGVWGAIPMSYSVLSPELAQLIAIFSYFCWQAVYSVLLFLKDNPDSSSNYIFSEQNIIVDIED